MSTSMSDVEKEYNESQIEYSESQIEYWIEYCRWLSNSILTDVRHKNNSTKYCYKISRNELSLRLHTLFFEVTLSYSEKLWPILLVTDSFPLSIKIREDLLRLVEEFNSTVLAECEKLSIEIVD
jgi:hypothetical protein